MLLPMQSKQNEFLTLKFDYEGQMMLWQLGVSDTLDHVVTF